MAQTKIGDPHGLYRIFVGLVNSTGYNYGQAANLAPANGTLLTPYNIRYAQSAEIALPDRTVVDFTGGDIWTGSFVYGITSLGTFQMTTSTLDADLIAMVGGSSVDQTTNTRWTIVGDNIMNANPPQVCVAIVFRLQSKETGSKGANKYLTMVLPRVWVTPKGVAGAPSFQAAGTYNYTIVPTVGDRMPWGPQFGTNQDFSENETPNFYIITDNPTHFVGFTAATGATEVVTLPYKPITFDYSSPDSTTNPVSIWIDGVSQDADSVVASTGAVTLTDVGGGAFAGGEYIGILYETNYEPTA